MPQSKLLYPMKAIPKLVSLFTQPFLCMMNPAHAFASEKLLHQPDVQVKSAAEATASQKNIIMRRINHETQRELPILNSLKYMWIIRYNMWYFFTPYLCDKLEIKEKITASSFIRSFSFPLYKTVRWKWNSILRFSQRKCNLKSNFMTFNFLDLKYKANLLFF